MKQTLNLDFIWSAAAQRTVQKNRQISLNFYFFLFLLYHFDWTESCPFILCFQYNHADVFKSDWFHAVSCYEEGKIKVEKIQSRAMMWCKSENSCVRIQSVRSDFRKIIMPGRCSIWPLAHAASDHTSHSLWTRCHGDVGAIKLTNFPLFLHSTKKLSFSLKKS